MSADTAVPPVVEMTGITIRFPGVLALDDVDFSLRPGEVHSLMGENGAGKVHSHQSPHRRLPCRRRNHPWSAAIHAASGRTADAQEAGISTVYQEVNLCANLSVGENVMLGHELRRGGGIDWKATHRAAAGHLRNLGLRPRHALDALEPLDRDPAARRHQPRHGARREGADPRRADLESGPRRSRAAVRGHPRPSGARRRHPVRQPLPRPGLRDLRPHHGAAQRPARRRVPGGRPSPR